MKRTQVSQPDEEKSNSSYWSGAVAKKMKSSCSAANSAAVDQTTRFLREAFKVDEETLASVKESKEKTFLVSTIPPGEVGSGICLASCPWLEFCGLSETDVAWQNPKDILQGPLTPKHQKKSMRSVFAAFPRGQTVMFHNIVNYRREWDSIGLLQLIPFRFTLTVKLLKSVQTSEDFDIYQAVMSEETDLTSEEIQRLGKLADLTAVLRSDGSLASEWSGKDRNASGESGGNSTFGSGGAKKAEKPRKEAHGDGGTRTSGSDTNGGNSSFDSAKGNTVSKGEIKVQRGKDQKRRHTQMTKGIKTAGGYENASGANNAGIEIQEGEDLEKVKTPDSYDGDVECSGDESSDEREEFVDAALCGVDQATIEHVKRSQTKAFLMRVCSLSDARSGICVANASWLKFCGLTSDEVLGRQPKELLQGPLTSASHTEQMHNFFTQLGKREAEESSSMIAQAFGFSRVPAQYTRCKKKAQEVLVIKDLINYRTEIKGHESGSPSVRRIPFKFTLTSQRLRSVITGETYPLFISTIEQAQDLSEEEQHRIRSIEVVND